MPNAVVMPTGSWSKSYSHCQAVFEVLSDNSHNLLFHRHLEADEAGSEELYVYFDYSCTHFEAYRLKFLSILEKEKRDT
jgi:hypothetical protein